jgi:tetratricopeptide (TPR) repeat protein
VRRSPRSTARELGEALVVANPIDPKLAHELARTLGNWTTGLPDNGSDTMVTPTLERVRGLLERVREANPTNSVIEADLAWIDTLLGGHLASAGRNSEALAVYERALAARERLSKANPLVTRHIEQQINLVGMIGSLHMQAGRAKDALETYERGRAITERLRATVAGLVEADPSAHRYRSLLADCIRRLGIILQGTGRAADAIGHYRRSIAELERVEKPTPIDLYDMACGRSLIAGAASTAGSGLTAAEARAEAELAVAGVRRAFDAGYLNLAWVRRDDPDLKPIRSRPDFQLLMMDLDFPADPFADSDGPDRKRK